MVNSKMVKEMGEESLKTKMVQLMKESSEMTKLMEEEFSTKMV